MTAPPSATHLISKYSAREGIQRRRYWLPAEQAGIHVHVHQVAICKHHARPQWMEVYAICSHTVVAGIEIATTVIFLLAFPLRRD